MERLLHYTWQHRLFPLNDLYTSQGEAVEVIDVGDYNTHAGPDFFNAKVRLGSTLWAGNVELHTRASDWYRHGHDSDAAYNNVILHVVSVADTTVTNALGKTIPQLVIIPPDRIRENFTKLLLNEEYPACKKVIDQLLPFSINSWLSALQAERLAQKCERLLTLHKKLKGDWEHLHFIALARSFGFGLNSETFALWAHNFPLNAAAKHRDNLFQLESLFLGTAGLLDEELKNEKMDKTTITYYTSLQQEYRYLSHKFNLQSIDPQGWKFLRLRPQSFPHIRLVQLALLYHKRQATFSNIISTETIEQLNHLLKVGVTPYWETHYTFGKASTKSSKQLSRPSLDLLIINTVAPLLFSYGKSVDQTHYCQQAISWWETIAPENNFIVRNWEACAITCRNAADSQALIQLHNEYCQPRKCLQCRFGYEYLKHYTWPIVKENETN